jgi:hypothetical protein
MGDDPLGSTSPAPRLGLSMRRSGHPPAPIGVLESTDSVNCFRYAAAVNVLQDFREVIGFPDRYRTYTSARLFPFFAQRVLQRDRPDFDEYVALLQLPATATTWELLARSGGTRKGDPYELLSEPHVAPSGRSALTFFVRGMRFLPDGPEPAAARVAALHPGESLALRDERDNVVNPGAKLVCDQSGLALGWVPDLLLPWVHVAHPGTLRAGVAAVNSGDSPWHLRLLVSMEAVVPVGFQLFAADEWAPLQSADDARAQTPISVA